jgi:hypothetical protein
MDKRNKKYTVHELWKSNKIYWIKTYRILIKYVSRDYKHIFKPTVIGHNTGKRYYVSEENINEFIRKFENNELSE